MKTLAGSYSEGGADTGYVGTRSRAVYIIAVGTKTFILKNYNIVVDNITIVVDEVFSTKLLTKFKKYASRLRQNIYKTF